MEYSIDDILAAKEVVRNAGYGVSLPDNKLDIAKNIAKANGYTVRKAEAAPVPPTPAAAPAPDINTALRIATDAGYTVRKNPAAIAQNAAPAPKPTPNVPPTPATPAEPAPAVTPAPAEPAPAPAPAKPAEPAHEPSWVEKIASRYV